MASPQWIVNHIIGKDYFKCPTCEREDFESIEEYSEHIKKC